MLEVRCSSWGSAGLPPHGSTVKKRPCPARAGILPAGHPGSSCRARVCVSPVRSLMTLRRAACQFFRTDPEFRLSGLSRQQGVSAMKLLTYPRASPLRSLRRVLWGVRRRPASAQNSQCLQTGDLARAQERTAGPQHPQYCHRPPPHGNALNETQQANLTATPRAAAWAGRLAHTTVCVSAFKGAHGSA